MTKRIFTIPDSNRGFGGVVIFDRYLTFPHPPALLVVDPMTHEPVARATVFLEAEPPCDGCTWLKTWSENEGLAELLVASGVGTLTGRSAINGLGTVAVEMKLSPQALEQVPPLIGSDWHEFDAPGQHAS